MGWAYWIALTTALLLWPEASSQPPVAIDSLRGFSIYCRFPPGEIAPLLDDLAHLSDDLQSYLGLPLGERQVIVHLFSNKTEYDRFLKQYFPDVPYRRALYIERSGQPFVLAYRSPNLAVDIRHECTHALLHSMLPMVPLWLDEGLAEYFELPPQERAFGNPYLRHIRFWARLGQVPSLQKLESIGRLEDLDASSYRAAWSWVHFMLHGPPAARQELIVYLRTIAAHGVPGQLSQRLATRLGDPSRAYLEHFRHWSQ